MADPKSVEGSINEKAKKLFETIKSITIRPSDKYLFIYARTQSGY